MIGLKKDEWKDAGQLLADLEEQGAAAAEISRGHPETLTELARAYSWSRARLHALRALLLRLRVPPFALVRLGSILPAATFRSHVYPLAKSCAFWRGVRRRLHDPGRWRQITGGTTILMYHAFGARGERGGRFVIPIRRFRAQMALLRLLRYRVISLRELVESRLRGELPAGRTVVITIDDGYADNHRLAYPVLRRYGYPATIFVVPGRVGGRGWDDDPEVGGRPLMRWEEIREIAAGGIEIGAHTRTHPLLTTIARNAAMEEIAGSKRDLETALGMPVRHFAYPYGDCDETVAEMAEAAGFDAACGTHSARNGIGADLLRLDRTEVFGTDSLFVFAVKLLTGSREILGPRSTERSVSRTESEVAPVSRPEPVGGRG